MRVLFNKLTSRIIESQSGEGDLDVLVKNAESYGFKADEVDAREVSDAEFNAMLKAQIEADRTYVDKRAREYPPMSEYLDAVVKGDNAQLQAYIDACLAVKAKYPK